MTALVVATLCVNSRRVYAAVREGSAVWCVVATRRGRSWDIRSHTETAPESVVRRLAARIPAEHRVQPSAEQWEAEGGMEYDGRYYRNGRSAGGKATCEAVRRLLVGR